MTKKRTTKRALMMSALSLLMCVSMLIGSTYAWFTDSVTSAGNIIKSGNLDVVMEWKDAANGEQQAYKDASAGPIFKYELWEPGYVEAKNVKIHNNGSLALKYKLFIDPETDLTEDGVKLADVIDVYFAEGEYKLADREMTELEKVGTLSEVLAGMPANMSGDLLAGETDKVTIALKMQESAGNEYKDLSLGKFSVILVATQMEAEFDSFDKDYDKDATYPMGKSDVAEKEYANINFKATVDIPDDAPEGYYSLSVPEDKILQNGGAGITTLNLEMDLMRADTPSGAPVKVENSGISYPVTIQLPHPYIKDVMEVYHNGVKIEDFEYDRTNNVVKFVTDSFSPFAIVYEDYTDPTFKLQYNKETLAINGGMFVNKDPRELDESLNEADSKYAVNEFTKDGNTYYVVSEEETTVVLDSESYSGKLWSVISGLQSNEHSTVLLKPGTYTEGTTIGVYSSMDIIGMGDAEYIKVEKAESSSSNRHLFNCSGTKADYIEVTLRNLTLDATAKTTNNKDNAAVQSIRKSKVKCYDLKIVKGTGWDAVAFYVNGNNAVDGVKYPAYLYAEDCTLNTTRTFGIVTTSGSYKFYHNNVKYGTNGDKDYTQNSGSIKNTAMAAYDWDW